MAETFNQVPGFKPDPKTIVMDLSLKIKILQNVEKVKQAGDVGSRGKRMRGLGRFFNLPRHFAGVREGEVLLSKKEGYLQIGS